MVDIVTKQARERAPGPAIILVEPQMGENIGAAARAMWNFGLDAMRIVAPRDGWPNPKAVAMAAGAGRVLDWASLHETTEEAVADLTYVLATTARPRGLVKDVLTPQEAAQALSGRIAAGQKVGLLFGRERTGLENDDVIRANGIVTVPVNPAFASLNLAQCVLLMAYEMKLAVSGDLRPEFQGDPEDRNEAPAAHDDVSRMIEHLETELDDAHFFYPEHKRASMQANLRNLFRRAPLTDQEVRTLRGVIRALSEKRRRG